MRRTMIDEEKSNEGDFSELFESHLKTALEDYDTKSKDYVKKPNLPEGTILTRDGLLEIQENPAKVRGGNFEADMVIDAKFSIYGRLASNVAKRVLDGWKIAVVNVEECVITGDPNNTVSTYQKRLKIGSDQGPIYPKQPDELFKNTVKGMLPHKKKRGRNALERLRAFKQNPYKVDGLKIKSAEFDHSGKEFIELKELSEKLGAPQDY